MLSLFIARWRWTNAEKQWSLCEITRGPLPLFLADFRIQIVCNDPIDGPQLRLAPGDRVIVTCDVIGDDTLVLLNRRFHFGGTCKFPFSVCFDFFYMSSQSCTWRLQVSPMYAFLVTVTRNLVDALDDVHLVSHVFWMHQQVHQSAKWSHCCGCIHHASCRLVWRFP